MPQRSPGTPKLLDQTREKLRVWHYACKTERPDITWVEKFLRFHRG